MENTLIEFAYSVFAKVTGNAAWEGIKALFPKKSLEKLENLSKEEKKEEFAETLKIMMELDSTIKENLLKLQKGESITTTNQHNIYGSNIGRDQNIVKS